MISHAQRSSLAFLGFALALAGAAALLLFASFGPGEVVAPVPAAPPAIGQGRDAGPQPIEAFLPNQKLDLPPDIARARNAALPFYRGANLAAPPFQPEWLNQAELDQSLECLTAAIYYEAATEPVAGQRAVAQVVLNRLRHPRYPKRICDVVYQGAERSTGCQFTFACDGSLARGRNARRWLIATAIANSALHGAVASSIGQATHYHASYVFARWAPELRKVAMIGTHIFYAPPQGYGGFSRSAPMVAEAIGAIQPPQPVLTPPPASAPAINRGDFATAANRPDALPTPLLNAPSPMPSPVPSPTQTAPKAAFPVPRAARRLPIPGQD